MAITKRIAQTAAPNTTRRLTPILTRVDPWGGAWGDAWSAAWGTLGYSLGLIANNTDRVSGAPSGGISGRVGEAPVGGQTSRVPHPLLLLEGDENGYLLLEGDMQSGDDFLKLEGDETVIGGTTTKRVTL